ncbi:cbb3-type cytochrome c oxidase subunit 3 [Aurantiacibacter flavus]|uniref:Cbb3-type cytochrome c oxidase subunit 3 n=1 Tax=Aurantiacibacter flavus TaxID=3145232 RepID=A0ABV0CXX8_9SPHN
MTFYEQLRHFADSYFLVFMFLVFLVLCLWPFRPGASKHVEDARNSIFKEDHDG